MSNVAEATATPAAKVIVTMLDPVCIVKRTSHKYGNPDDPNSKKPHGIQVSEAPHCIVPAADAMEMVKHLNTTPAAVSRGEKTSHVFAISDSPVIVNVKEHLESLQYDKKRDLLKTIPAATRALLGLPDPDADDEIIAAWNPAPAATAAK